MQIQNLIQWSLWGLSVAGAAAAIVALFKLEFLQRFIPTRDEADRLTALLPVLEEEEGGRRRVIETLQNEIAQLESQVGHLRILKEWQDVNPDGPARIQQMMADLERCKSELAAVQHKLAEEEARRNDLLRQTSDLGKEKADLEGEIPVLRDRLAALCREEDALGKRVRELEGRHGQLDQKLDALTAEIRSQEARLADLAGEVDKAEQERAQACRERDSARAERDAARAELAGLQKALEALKAMAENVNAHLKETGAGAQDITRALEDLAQPALRFSFKAAARLDEGTALRRFAAHLRARGLQFPERVQLAFHTSLKAAHINPLVVLAGVSGTGKSALPMAYAEALGINFLSLAVQPGWSSPQDLLGFYNYLERKYKATELARALAQMSRFSAQDLRGLPIESRKGQMLLLLLDEMNLARIEYYFSDFLSRLEQRRGRDVENEQRRREVSLLVDAGSLPQGESPRFIFPDFNVLFVGTMNEDESTQSLSDKVIDRANVLRFGAPKNLAAVPTEPVQPQDEFLPHDTWRQWVRHFDGTGFGDEQRMLAELNEALEQVKRPFGHRVYRAMLDYLANYPDVSGDATRRQHALADQIEQKIIPKLRGLDTQDDATSRCLDRIADLIGRLNDPELADAFMRARQEHLFEWFGVKRAFAGSW